MFLVSAVSQILVKDRTEVIPVAEAVEQDILLPSNWHQGIVVDFGTSNLDRSKILQANHEFKKK